MGLLGFNHDLRNIFGQGIGRQCSILVRKRSFQEKEKTKVRQLILTKGLKKEKA